ncbi:hypothetical protein [Haloarchaeobius sp. DFWS5]|uniref:hypothetical protein n=1 Tax=Haloarchaeobius sp. DFWS5 TaxID=3446114 RepID=UPI003EBB7FF2
MATELTERVQEIAASKGVPESETLKRALERGVEALWADLVLSRYISDEIDREKAIELVGRAHVKRAERELDAVEDGVRWGLSG